MASARAGGGGAASGAPDGTSAVRELQLQIARLSELKQRVDGAVGALKRTLERRASAAGGASTDPAAQTARLLTRTERAVGELRRADTAFQSKLEQESKAAGTNLQFKKLRSDYERRLNVAAALRAADAVLKKGSLVVSEAKRRAAQLKQEEHEQRLAARGSENAELASENAAQTIELEQEQRQEQVAVEQDQYQSVQEEAALERVAQDSTLLQQVATEVGCLVEVQQDDLDRLEDNTDQSVSRAIDGVHEFSQLRRRQAGRGAAKATFGTATIGGLVGIVGGPVGIAIGAVAGGAVGALAGKGVAAVKRRSINAETRRIKALLAVRKERTGEFTLQVHAYENQAWSFLKRRWLPEQTWTDEFGEPCGEIHPGVELTATEARMLMLSAATAEASNADLDELSKSYEREVRLGVQWKWATSNWNMLMERPDTDLAGWDFAPTMTSALWYPEAKRGCHVRRRLWVRYLVGKPSQAALAEAAAALATDDARLAAPDGSSRKSQDLWHNIYTTNSATNEILGETLKRVNLQGDQVGKAERSATVVSDIALYSERIHRAGNLSGAIRNLMSWQTGNLSESDQMAAEYQRRRQLAAQEDDESRVRALQTPVKDYADATSQKLEDNLRIARRMANEIDLQNEQLDRTSVAVERGNEGMLRAAKRVK